MKSLFALLMTFVCLLSLSSCQGGTDITTDPTTAPTEPTAPDATLTSFKAVVLEQYGKSIVVEPLEGEAERASCDRISVSPVYFFPVGFTVEITYNGEIAESYPAQIRAVDCESVDNVNDTPLSVRWIDTPSETEPDTDEIVRDAQIIEVYQDAFVVWDFHTPETIKVNAPLPAEFCEGDYVNLTLFDVVHDADSDRAEGKLKSAEMSEFQHLDKCEKPVIYLYPEETTDVSVTLDLQGELTCTYPRYQDGWQVTASPDGTLTDANGQTYNYLYWEGETDARWDFSEGFCVKGEDTAAFLTSALSDLGLSRREANEFIVYWLPSMEQNPYNLIAFQTEVYREVAALHVSPTPDTMIRVFMTYQPLDTPVDIPAQTLTSPAREGFTVVEWGGTEVR